MLILDKQGEPSPELNRTLLWALKLFFIPVYGMTLFLNIAAFTHVQGLAAVVLGIYALDLAFAVVGYLFASARTFFSVQPLGLGWVVCLVCYPPFVFQFRDAAGVLGIETNWPQRLPEPLLAVPMLLLLALYFSATIAFGIRFSNLGYRGVITTGPYKWMKHPAYFCHAAFAWMTVVFFVPLSIASVSAASVLTVIYWLRSVTEEWHLRQYPDYVAYCDFIAERGVLARLKNLLRIRQVRKPAIF
jgi:protein-S-isoprenylcysteine O-methyltransferase Ste14